MFQKFFTDTIENKFIKSLLNNTPIPIYPSIGVNDFMINGCTYINKYGIIRCTKTGNENAKFIRLHPYLFGQHIKQFTEKFLSKCNYYDTATHEVLGNYLRLYRDLFGINLMPFYNCFSYHFLEDMHLTLDNSSGYELTQDLNYKIAAIPIKFDKTYTICLDSSTNVLLKAFLHDNLGNMIIDIGGSKVASTELLKDCAINISFNNEEFNTTNDGVINLPQTSFGNPIKFEIKLDSDSLTDSSKRKLKLLEKYLYLTIQIPNDNNSSIVVLEGNFNINDNNTNIYNIEKDYYIYDYSQNENNPTKEFIDRDKILENILNNNTNYIKSNISYNDISNYAFNTIVSLLDLSNNDKKNNFLLSDLSLMQINTKEIYAFSDRLIEYLLLNVVDSEDTIDNNTIKIQDIFELFNYKDTAPGVWTNKLRYILYKKYMLKENNSKLDINGFVDKNIEQMIIKMDGDY